MSPRILIIRLSSIGDILLTTPFIQQVRKKFPTANISYILKKEFADLLINNPHINDLILLDSSLGISGLMDLARQLKEKKFDIVFDLHNNLRSNRLTSVFKRSIVSRINKNKIKRALLIYLKINLFKQIRTISEKYLLVGKRYQIKDNGEKLQIFLNDESEKKVQNYLSENDLEKNEYISFAPGAAHFTKMWPAEYMEDLINKTLRDVNTKIVLLGGANEKDILPKFESNESVINFCGKTSLLESAGILKYSKGIITNDSGLMHMASAVNIPLVAIFGSTVEELGFFPYRANASVLEIKDLRCRPCTHIGKSKCPLNHFNCMRLISVERVFAEMEKKIVR
jgi:lipopolysaccharide heptosyltransferase II